MRFHPTDQIPQIQFLCVFRRNPGKSTLGSCDASGNRTGGVAVAVVTDGGDRRVADYLFLSIPGEDAIIDNKQSNCDCDDSKNCQDEHG